MRVRYIDVGNPVGAPLREVWAGGPVGYNESEIIGAAALVKCGHDVTIFGQTKTAHEVEGVKIRPLPDFDNEKFDASMFFWGHFARADWAPYQQPDKIVLDIAESLKGPVLSFGYKPMSPEPKKFPAKHWRFLSFSRWHTQYMLSRGVLADSITFVGHPIHPDNAFDAELGAKRPLLPRCLYASSWDRGLEPLLEMWPKIRAQVPEAELYVTYAPVREDAFKHLRKDGIFFVGNLSFAKIKELFHVSHVLLFPCLDDVETFCYTVVKAQMAGCVPVVTPTGALPEAVVDGGGIVSRPDKFLEAALSLLRFPPFWQVRSRKCKSVQTQSPYDFARRLERAWEECL